MGKPSKEQPDDLLSQWKQERLVQLGVSNPVVKSRLNRPTV